MSNKSDAKSSKMCRRYHEDFKRDAVKLSQDLGSVAEAARQLGISESSLCKWRIKYSAADAAPSAHHATYNDAAYSEPKDENALLKKQLHDAQQANVIILKKAMGIFLA